MGRFGMLKSAAATLAISTVLLGSGMVQARTLQLSNLYPENHPLCIQTHNFAQFVEEGTNGEIEVEVFCNNQLGNEREASEAVRRGSIDLVMSGGGGIGRFLPELYVLELPFLYSNMEEINGVTWAVVDDINALANDRGYEMLGFGYEGPRSIASTRSFDTLEGLQGYRLRIPEAPLYVGLAQALGAVPTPTAFTEAYTSLQTGVADGLEAGPSTVYNNKFYEVAPYLVLTEHIINPCYLAINLDLFNSFTEEQQQVLRDAGRRATDMMVGDVEAANARDLQRMEEEGVTIVELAPGEPERFQEVLLPFSEEYAAGINEDAVQLLSKIRTVLEDQ